MHTCDIAVARSACLSGRGGWLARPPFQPKPLGGGLESVAIPDTFRTLGCELAATLGRVVFVREAGFAGPGYSPDVNCPAGPRAGLFVVRFFRIASTAA